MNHKYFFPFCGMSFIFMMSWNRIVFNLDEVQFIFLLLYVLLMLYLRKHSLPNPRSWRCMPRLSSRSFMVLALTLRSMINFKLTFNIWYKGQVRLLIFYMWISSSPSSICWKDYSFSIELSCHTYQKINRSCEGLLLDSQSYVLINTSILITVSQVWFL